MMAAVPMWKAGSRWIASHKPAELRSFPYAGRDVPKWDGFSGRRALGARQVLCMEDFASK
jgi:hypothetical protein